MANILVEPGVDHEDSTERITSEDQAYERIKYAILHKELKPGEKVSHTEWAERLNISRTPVRDTLKRLEYEGLIIRETERQWRVYTMTIEDVYKLYEVIQSVEGFVARLAAENCTPEMDEELRGILARMEVAKDQRDYQAFAVENNAFHALLEHSADNPFLKEVSVRARDKLYRIRARDLHIEGRLAQSYEENRKITEALIERDAEKAERLQREHLRSSRDYTILLLKQLIIPYVGPEF